MGASAAGNGPPIAPVSDTRTGDLLRLQIAGVIGERECVCGGVFVLRAASSFGRVGSWGSDWFVVDEGVNQRAIRVSAQSSEEVPSVLLPCLYERVDCCLRSSRQNESGEVVGKLERDKGSSV